MSPLYGIWCKPVELWLMRDRDQIELFNDYNTAARKATSLNATTSTDAYEVREMDQTITESTEEQVERIMRDYGM